MNPARLPARTRRTATAPAVATGPSAEEPQPSSGREGQAHRERGAEEDAGAGVGAVAGAEERGGRERRRRRRGGRAPTRRRRPRGAASAAAPWSATMPERSPSTTMATARWRYVTRVMLATSAMAPVTNQGRRRAARDPAEQGQAAEEQEGDPACRRTRCARASAAGSTGARSSISASEARSGLAGSARPAGARCRGTTAPRSTGSRGGRIARGGRDGGSSSTGGVGLGWARGGRGGSGVARPAGIGLASPRPAPAPRRPARCPGGPDAACVPETGGGSLLPRSPAPCAGGDAGSGSGPLARVSAAGRGVGVGGARRHDAERVALPRLAGVVTEAGRLAPELPGGRVGFCEGEARGKGAREFSHTSEALGIHSK